MAEENNTISVEEALEQIAASHYQGDDAGKKEFLDSAKDLLSVVSKQLKGVKFDAAQINGIKQQFEQHKDAFTKGDASNVVGLAENALVNIAATGFPNDDKNIAKDLDKIRDKASELKLKRQPQIGAATPSESDTSFKATEQSYVPETTVASNSSSSAKPEPDKTEKKADEQKKPADDKPISINDALKQIATFQYQSDTTGKKEFLDSAKDLLSVVSKQLKGVKFDAAQINGIKQQFEQHKDAFTKGDASNVVGLAENALVNIAATGFPNDDKNIAKDLDKIRDKASELKLKRQPQIGAATPSESDTSFKATEQSYVPETTVASNSSSSAKPEPDKTEKKADEQKKPADDKPISINDALEQIAASHYQGDEAGKKAFNGYAKDLLSVVSKDVQQATLSVAKVEELKAAIAEYLQFEEIKQPKDTAAFAIAGGVLSSVIDLVSKNDEAKTKDFEALKTRAEKIEKKLPVILSAEDLITAIAENVYGTEGKIGNDAAKKTEFIDKANKALKDAGIDPVTLTPEQQTAIENNVAKEAAKTNPLGEKFTDVETAAAAAALGVAKVAFTDKAEDLTKANAKIQANVQEGKGLDEAAKKTFEKGFEKLSNNAGKDPEKAGGFQKSVVAVGAITLAYQAVKRLVMGKETVNQETGEVEKTPTPLWKKVIGLVTAVAAVSIGYQSVVKGNSIGTAVSEGVGWAAYVRNREANKSKGAPPSIS
jgi:hypothetical protein